MFIINENAITIRRGDSGKIAITLTDGYGVETKIPAGAVVKLTVREYADTSDPVLLSVSETVQTAADEVTLAIPPSATKLMDVGAYSCDIQVTMSGDVYTILPADATRYAAETNWKNFTVLAEVSE